MKNWPWYGYLVFAVLIFALAYFFYFKPEGAKLKALTAERIKVEGEVKNLKEKKRELVETLAAVRQGPLPDEEMAFMRTYGDAVHRAAGWFM